MLAASSEDRQTDFIFNFSLYRPTVVYHCGIDPLWYTTVGLYHMVIMVVVSVKLKTIKTFSQTLRSLGSQI